MTQRQRDDRTLKNIIKAIAIATLLTLTFVGGQMYQRNHDRQEPRLYQVEARVLYHEEDETILKDFNVTLTLNDQGTAKVIDDEIIEVR